MKTGIRTCGAEVKFRIQYHMCADCYVTQYLPKYNVLRSSLMSVSFDTVNLTVSITFSDLRFFFLWTVHSMKSLKFEFLRVTTFCFFFCKTGMSLFLDAHEIVVQGFEIAAKRPNIWAYTNGIFEATNASLVTDSCNRCNKVANT